MFLPPNPGIVVFELYLVGILIPYIKSSTGRFHEADWSLIGIRDFLVSSKQSYGLVKG
jgi:hypothetical protein